MANTIDPFADLEETQAESTPESKETTTMTTATTDSQSKIVTTLKGGAGYDAPWVVIHSDTAEEALEVLKDENLKELLDQAKKVGQYFGGGSSSRPAANGKPVGATQAPAGAPEPPEGYVYKTGMGKSGRPWYAFMGANRSDNLDPIWLNADGTRRG